MSFNPMSTIPPLVPPGQDPAVIGNLFVLGNFQLIGRAVELSDGDITFTSLNLDETNSKKLAQNLKVSGQALLIVRGEERLNLTSEGFMNARTNPEKFHEILKTQIDKLL